MALEAETARIEQEIRDAAQSDQRLAHVLSPAFADRLHGIAESLAVADWLTQQPQSPELREAEIRGFAPRGKELGIDPERYAELYAQLDEDG